METRRDDSKPSRLAPLGEAPESAPRGWARPHATLRAERGARIVTRPLLTRALAVVIFAGAAAPAWAGVGTTVSLGGLQDGTAWVPSIDWREGRVLVQLHLLDQLAPVAAGEAFYPRTGADVSVAVYRHEVAGPVVGVVMPGLGFRLEGAAPVGWNLSASARLGMEAERGLGLGLYAVPSLGVTTLLTGSPNVNYGGTLQVSAWLGK